MRAQTKQFGGLISATENGSRNSETEIADHLIREDIWTNC